MPHKNISIQNYRQTVNYSDVISYMTADRTSLVDLITFPSDKCILFSAIFEVTEMFGDDPLFINSNFKDIAGSIGFTFPDYSDDSIRQTLVSTGYKDQWGLNFKTNKKFSLHGTDTLRLFVDCAITDPVLSTLTQGILKVYISYGDITLA